jgi:rRNA maturation endonuclease Nob1
MPVCRKCQTPYDTQQHFCWHCGHSLRDESLPAHQCPGCGRQVSLEQNFCQECGVHLQEKMARPATGGWRKWLAGGMVATFSANHR